MLFEQFIRFADALTAEMIFVAEEIFAGKFVAILVLTVINLRFYFLCYNLIFEICHSTSPTARTEIVRAVFLLI